MSVPGVRLPGDVVAPQLGLGTWQLRGRECRRVVEEAIGLGYRHIDTAEGYDNERDVGRGVAAAGVDRSELWITSKVWRDNLEPDDLRAACHDSLRRLGTDHLDLLLIHWPNRSIPIARTVDGMAALLADGKIRAWGVSNFTPAHLREAVEVAESRESVRARESVRPRESPGAGEAAGKPATNQVELHPYFHQRELVTACRELGVPITAYTPLAKGRVTDDDVLREIAGAHRATPAQIALAWTLGHGRIAIPKASSAGHLRANLEAVDIGLSEDEMRRIDELPQRPRMVDGSWSEFDR